MEGSKLGVSRCLLTESGGRSALTIGQLLRDRCTSVTLTLLTNTLYGFAQTRESPLTIDQDGAFVKKLGHAGPCLNGRYWTVLIENGQYGREKRPSPSCYLLTTNKVALTAQTGTLRAIVADRRTSNARLSEKSLQPDS